MLKTIEGFAVECSMNKVCTSEALAYAVDEALQVFGGNGYSREFPVERAYRDARITRIYEGTNEINRLIIATRLLKNAEACSPLTRPRRTAAPHSTPSAGRSDDETAGADRARHGGTHVWRCRPRRAGSGGARRQRHHRVLCHRKRHGRAEKMATRGSDRAGIAADIARIYTSDALDRVAHAGKQIVNALAARAERIDPLIAAVAHAREHPGRIRWPRAAGLATRSLDNPVIPSRAMTRTGYARRRSQLSALTLQEAVNRQPDRCPYTYGDHYR